MEEKKKILLEFFNDPSTHTNESGIGIFKIIRPKSSLPPELKNRSEIIFEVESDDQKDKSKPIYLYSEPGTNEDMDEFVMYLGLQDFIRVEVQTATTEDYFWLHFDRVVRQDEDIKLSPLFQHPK
ncbi:MAG: hypothetical protein EZS28_029210 [Streblomastix strix]|uniref:Uncharacterized protein n=1 Tax=Streblomastix strix TaxID=222440 RepID=A0A5J4UYE8_9EUKA|nr:MAG: hypothetical protein EZS28_029210 [Streblomastix strix]